MPVVRGGGDLLLTPVTRAVLARGGRQSAAAEISPRTAAEMLPASLRPPSGSVITRVRYSCQGSGLGLRCRRFLGRPNPVKEGEREIGSTSPAMVLGCDFYAREGRLRLSLCDVVEATFGRRRRQRGFSEGTRARISELIKKIDNINNEKRK